MSIQFSGTLTEQQFNRFQQCCMPALLRWILKGFPWFWLGFALIKVLSLSGYITSFGLAFDIFLFVYFLVVIPKLRERQIKRAWQSNKLIQGEISGVVDQERIVWSHAYGELRCPWEIILKYREVADIFLLYTSLNQAILLPRSFFQSDADWHQFRQLVAEKLPKK
ncbi:hypothetical protein BST81_15320 [Leptolyngbya sp. 'hensonii']|uniref:YcxB family protein n=1 Tax=Leptolyngbya sp. 'hensonii' TaxID=1922337 RepID=UPI0009502C02|nr:YcxB family protein [Leptolyngbya sp. 'hensonii']OLP17688.1 hypothetical protein BST81_15320 [Leptolyngbya sp. 'hensonii']